MAKPLEPWQVLEKDVALEIFGYHEYAAEYGDGYVIKDGPKEKWVACSPYTRNIYRALSAAREVIKQSEGVITKISLDMGMIHGSEEWEYTFKFHFRNDMKVVVNNTHACTAICELSLFVRRSVLPLQNLSELVRAEHKSFIEVSPENINEVWS